MNRQQLCEPMRVCRHGAENAIAQCAPRVQEKHGARQERRPPSDARMVLLIKREIAGDHGAGESGRLLKQKAQPFARDRVDGTRGVAHERDVPAHHGTEPPAYGDAPSFGAVV